MEKVSWFDIMINQFDFWSALKKGKRMLEEAFADMLASLVMQNEGLCCVGINYYVWLTTEILLEKA